MLTLDTDVALPVRLEVREQDLRDRLASAGFKERFLGEHQPPATRYRLGEEEGSFYVEFLTPFIGSEHDRDGNLRATTRVAGVTSQNLRYVDLLRARRGRSSCLERTDFLLKVRSRSGSHIRLVLWHKNY